MAQTVKNPSTMWETWVQSLGWEDPLEKGMATHSSILAWRIPMDRGDWRAAVSPWSYKKSDMAERLSTSKLKKAEYQRIDAFELWCWRRLLRVPWIARRSNQSILKAISPGCSLEGLMLKLKLQYFGHLT